MPPAHPCRTLARRSLRDSRFRVSTTLPKRACPPCFAREAGRDACFPWASSSHPRGGSRRCLGRHAVVHADAQLAPALWGSERGGLNKCATCERDHLGPIPL